MAFVPTRTPPLASAQLLLSNCKLNTEKLIGRAIARPNKKYLAEVKELLRTFLADELRLDLNNKTATDLGRDLTLCLKKTVWQRRETMKGNYEQCILIQQLLLRLQAY
jgi:hypothetical protein